jgi:predicted RNase H-like nuclease
MVLLAGIDLAWTETHETGVCLVEMNGAGCHVVELSARVVTPGGLAAKLAGLGDVVFVAIDAPLIVTPERRAEHELGKAFGAYKASAHSANLELLIKTERMAGPMLADELAASGFSLDPTDILPSSAGWHAIEVYPHAAHVRLFDLTEHIPYKQKAHRPVGCRRKQFGVYQGLLAGLLGRDLPGLLESAELRGRLAPAATLARGAALKRLEDELDAITCMYVAFHAWRLGSAGLDVYGSVRDGYIAVPRAAAKPA